MSIKIVKLSRINVESVSYVGEKNTHFWPWWIVLRAVTIYRPETQTNKLKLALANSSLLSDFCHLNVMFICLLSLKWEKWQNSDKNCKLVTLTSCARYAITTPIYLAVFRLGNSFVLSFQVQIIFTLKKMFTVCRVSPTSTPQNTHAHTHCYNYGPCLTLKSILHCFLKLFHCMTITITLGPGEGTAATNQ